MPITTEELSQFDDEFRNAKPPEASGGQDFTEPVPDGIYQVKVKTAELKHSRAGNPMISWCLEIVGGNRNFLGRWIWKNSVIQSGKPLEFLKKDLATAGLRPPAFSALPSMLGRVVGKVLEVQKKTDGEFTNVYFNRALSAAVAPSAPEQIDESEVPF